MRGLSGPDDPYFNSLDPIKERWMYESWLQDKEERVDELRHHGILIGSFHNSEAARQMMAAEKPTHSTTDEEFEKSTAMVMQARNEQLQKQAEQGGHRRRRKKRVPINKGQ